MGPVRHLTHQVRMVHLTEGTIQYYPDEDSTDTENSMLLKTTGGGSRTWSEAQINTDDLHGEKATGDELSHLQNPDGRVYYQIFFVVMPIFCLVLSPREGHGGHVRSGSPGASHLWRCLFYALSGQPLLPSRTQCGLWFPHLTNARGSLHDFNGVVHVDSLLYFRVVP